MTLITKHFSQLTLDELYTLLKIRAEVFVVEQTCPYNDLDDKDKNAYHLFLTHQDQGQILAYLRVLDQGVSFPDAASIGRVLTTQRGKGYGKQLMKKGMELTQSVFHADKIRIEAQVYAQAFYEQLGFMACSEVFLEDGIAHVEMFYDH